MLEKKTYIIKMGKQNKTFNWDKTWKIKLWTKTQQLENIPKLKTSKGDQTQKLKLGQN